MPEHKVNPDKFSSNGHTKDKGGSPTHEVNIYDRGEDSIPLKTLLVTSVAGAFTCAGGQILSTSSYVGSVYLRSGPEVSRVTNSSDLLIYGGFATIVLALSRLSYLAIKTESQS
jgi:hypothetical protein